MRFKEFIRESKKPTFTKLGAKEAIALMNKHCKDALWMLANNSPLYRGTDKVRIKQFAVADPTLTTRRSANTSNFYTLFIDNHPKMKGKPLRSKSFIGSRSSDTAGSYGDVSIVIPFDGVQFGDVGHDDIWNLDINLFGEMTDITSINHLCSELSLPDKDYSTLINAIHKLDFAHRNVVQIFREFFNVRVKNAAAFLQEINRALDPDKLKFKFYTTKTFKTAHVKSSDYSEVWIGGQCMFINPSLWEEMIKINARQHLNPSDFEAYEFYEKWLIELYRGEYLDDDEMLSPNDFVKYAAKDFIKTLEWLKVNNFDKDKFLKIVVHNEIQSRDWNKAGNLKWFATQL